MKRTILFIAILFVVVVCKAQITYEHSYFQSTVGTIGQEFFLTNIGDEDYKYVIYDYDSAKFSLYNLNHTPFLLNVSIPITSNPATSTYYRLGYISKSLFDCDSTNIEYAMMLNTPRPTEHPNFAVYRTDGTMLFSKDTVGTVFCVGCGSGSYEMHPIMNTTEGAKLYLFNQNLPGYIEYFVYSLCGTKPSEIEQPNNDQSNSYVKAFPNPGSQTITFEILPPGNLDQYELIIFNSALEVINSIMLEGESRFNLNAERFSSGTYFYSLQNKNKVFKTGKFILSH